MSGALWEVEVKGRLVVNWVMGEMTALVVETG